MTLLEAGRVCLLESFVDASDASLRRMLLTFELVLELELAETVDVLISAEADFSMDVAAVELVLELELELEPLLTGATFLGGSEARFISTCC